METYTLMFIENLSTLSYIRKKLKADNIEFTVIEKPKTEVSMLCDRTYFETLVAEIICCIYKHKCLSKTENIIKNKDIVYYALRGIALGVGNKSEKENIIDSLPQGNFLFLDGICNFTINDIIISWEGLGMFLHSLYANCLSRQDRKAIVEYFYSKGIEEKRRIILDGGIYYDDSNQDVLIYDLYDDYETNLVVTLFSLLPREIIILKPNKYNNGFIEFIKELGR